MEMTKSEIIAADLVEMSDLLFTISASLKSYPNGNVTPLVLEGALSACAKQLHNMASDIERND